MDWANCFRIKQLHPNSSEEQCSTQDFQPCSRPGGRCCITSNDLRHGHHEITEPDGRSAPASESASIDLFRLCSRNRHNATARQDDLKHSEIMTAEVP